MPKNIKINLADCLGTSNKCGKVDEQRIWEFQRRLETLEAKPDNDNQLLSLTDNKLSITKGNEVVLPVYDDTKLSEKVKELENRPQGSNQTLSLDGVNLSISEGNTVKLPAIGLENADTILEKTEIKYAIKGDYDGNTYYITFTSPKGDKIKLRLPTLVELISQDSDYGEFFIDSEGKLGFNNGNPTYGTQMSLDSLIKLTKLTKKGDKLVLELKNPGWDENISYTLSEVDLPSYDDEPLKARVKALEDKPDSDNQTLTLSGDTLSISNGNSVKVPQMVQWYPHIAWAEEINPVKNFTTRTSVSAPQSAGFYANYVGFCYTTDKEDPQEPSKYRWTRVSQVTELEKQLEELKKNGLTSTPQTLSIEGNTLTISEGNSVELPTSTNKELEKVVENLKPLSNNISGERGTYSGHSLYINKIGDFVHLTFNSYAVRNIYKLPEGFRPKFTQTAPLWHKETGEYVGKVVLEPNGDFNETLVDKFKPLSYPIDRDPHDGTNIFENIHTLTMSYYVGG